MSLFTPLGSNSDFFASELLATLAAKDPIFAAYEAQDVSRRVGFDFDSISTVLDRALDEVRETCEAYDHLATFGKEHLGDEIADIMFSLVNLIRHRNVEPDQLPALDELVQGPTKVGASQSPDITSFTDIAIGSMRQIADETITLDAALKCFTSATKACVGFAESLNFEADQIVRDNVQKYLARCAAIEDLAKHDSKDWSDLYRNGEIIAYWKRAKVTLDSQK